MLKPEKPNADYPLYSHPNGQWCKKVNGKNKYFGKWEDPDAALASYRLYLSQKESAAKAEVAPCSPRKETTVREILIDLDNLTVTNAVKLHLHKIQDLVDTGELSKRTKCDRTTICKLLEAHFKNKLIRDTTPDDWLEFRKFIARGRTVVSLANIMNRVKTIFNWLEENDYHRLPNWGTGVKTPAQRLIRLEQQKHDRQLTAYEIRSLILAADEPLRAMILLGINCGLGNSDCARLDAKHVDYKKMWLRYPRFKTGVKRRAKLWPETLEAIMAWMRVRPKFKDTTLFVTKYGNHWSDDGKKSAISQRFRDLLDELGMYREGIGFYSLRRMTETIGGRCKDQVAVNFVMGHLDSTMADTYRLGIDGERLEAVSNEIRNWLELEKIDYENKLTA